MGISNRVMTAALFAEKIVPIAMRAETVNSEYASPAQELSTALSKAGVLVLGSGHYGAVLRIPGTDDVLKVCTCETDGYPTYAQWAQHNHGPGIPDIFWSIRISEYLFMCAMPVYRVLTSEDEDRVTALRDQGEYAAEPPSYLGKAEALVNKELGRFARKDMHTGNFMYCPMRGEYIITDPFAELRTTQDEAEGYATGKPRVPPIKEQGALDFDVPVTVTGQAPCSPGLMQEMLIPRGFAKGAFTVPKVPIHNLPKITWPDAVGNFAEFKIGVNHDKPRL